jgi:hypothetical protein
LQCGLNLAYTARHAALIVTAVFAVSLLMTSLLMKLAACCECFLG